MDVFLSTLAKTPSLQEVTVGHLIQGIQANKVMADIKHFAFNDQETGRTVVDVQVSKKAAHESDCSPSSWGYALGSRQASCAPITR
jgi:beta-glucosidase